MRLGDLDFRFSEDEVQPPALRPLFDRLRRMIGSIREAFVEVEGQARVIRHNVPPTTPATPAALPTASVKYLGVMALLDKDSVTNDELWICIRDAGGAYAWHKLL